MASCNSFSVSHALFCFIICTSAFICAAATASAKIDQSRINSSWNRFPANNNNNNNNTDIIGIGTNDGGAIFITINFETGASKLLSTITIPFGQQLNGAVYVPSQKIFVLSILQTVTATTSVTFLMSVDPVTGQVRSNATLNQPYSQLTSMQWDEENDVVYGFVYDSDTWKVARCDPFAGLVKVLWDTEQANLTQQAASAFDPQNRRFIASFGLEPSWWLTVPVDNVTNTNLQRGLYRGVQSLAYDLTTNTLDTLYVHGTEPMVDFAVVNMTLDANATVSLYDLTEKVTLIVEFPGVADGGYYYAPMVIDTGKLVPGVLILDALTGRIVEFKPMAIYGLYYPSWLSPNGH